MGRRLPDVPRLRQRLAKTPLGVAAPVWVDDQEFDVASHVVGVATDGPVGRRQLRSIVGRLMGERLDARRPLWRVDVVDPLGDGGMALVVRLHHCMADGTMAMQILSGILLDSAPDPPLPAIDAWAPARGPGKARLLGLGLADRLRGVAGGARAGASAGGRGHAAGDAATPGYSARDTNPERDAE